MEGIDGSDDAQEGVVERAISAGPGLPTTMRMKESWSVLYQLDLAYQLFYLTVPMSRCRSTYATHVVAGRHLYVPCAPRLQSSSSHVGPQNYGRRGRNSFELGRIPGGRVVSPPGINGKRYIHRCIHFPNKLRDEGRTESSSTRCRGRVHQPKQVVGRRGRG